MILRLLLLFFSCGLMNAASAQYELQWAQMIHADYSLVLSTVTDRQGNVYTAGAYRGNGAMFNTLLFPDGSGGSGFVAKQSFTGDVLWVRHFRCDNASAVSQARKIILDTAGNIYVTGTYTGRMDADPGLAASDTFFLAPHANSGTFLVKLDPQGTFLWANSFEGNVNSVFGLDTDERQQVYLYLQYRQRGWYRSVGRTDTVVGRGSEDMLLVTVAPSGSLIRTMNIGSSVYDEVNINMANATALHVADAEHIYIIGKTPASVAPLFFGAQSVTVGQGQTFIACLDTAGLKWIKQYRASAANGITGSRNREHVAACMLFDGTRDFNPGGTPINLASPGMQGTAVVKLDSSGSFKWAKMLGRTGPALPTSIAMDEAGHVITLGIFATTVDMDPDDQQQQFLESSTVQADGFVSVLDSTGVYVWAGAIQGTAAEDMFSVYADASGGICLAGTSSSSRVDCDPGPDSLFLTNSASAFNSVVIKIRPFCNLAASATRLPDRLSASQGGPGAMYQWFNCIVGMPVPGATAQDLMTAGLAPGEYAVIIGNTNDCADTSACIRVCSTPVVTAHADRLTATPVPGASYQWIDCADRSVLPGATDSVLTIASGLRPGSFAVIIATPFGCSDTSACVSYTTGNNLITGYDGNTTALYPNPVKDRLHLTCSVSGMLQLYSPDGRLAAAYAVSPGQNSWSAAQLAPGMYGYMLTDAQGQVISRGKLVRQD